MPELTPTQREPNALVDDALTLPDNDSMPAVLTAIRYDMSLDPTKTEKKVKKRMSDFVTVVNHMAKSLGVTADRLTVSAAVENEAAFLNYIARSNLSPASKAKLPNNRDLVLQYARKFHFSPQSFTLLEEWDPIMRVLSPEYGASAIAKDAIRRKRRRTDFSQADLAVWADAALDAGRTFSYVRHAQAAFLKTIRNAELQGLFPQLDAAVRVLPSYKLRIEDMPEPLRAEIHEVLDSRRAKANLGTARISPTTEREIIHHFEDLCGFADGVRGMAGLISLRPLLNEPFVTEFAFWQRKERNCKRTTVVGRLSRMFSALESSAAFKDCDFSWIASVYRKLRKEPESAVKERRRQRFVPFQSLATIPDLISCERSALEAPSNRQLGQLIHDELLLAALILAQWPAHFVRTAEIGQHVFKGPIPKEGPTFSTPSWAQRILCENPDAEFWQFRYVSPNGELHRGLVLERMASLLELYVKKYRPLLVGPDGSSRLFCNKIGLPLSPCTLGNLVAYRVWQYIGKRVTITAIRSSFAYYWRERHPNKDALLAQIQWVDFPTIKMRYDEQFRIQRAARVHRRKHRYQ